MLKKREINKWTYRDIDRAIGKGNKQKSRTKENV